MSPSKDPTNERYINDSDRTWCSGQWQTREQMERRRARRAERARTRYANDPGYRERIRERVRLYGRQRLGWYDDDPGLKQFIEEVVNA